MSVCTRCGKQRVVASSHEEVIAKSTVVYTETVCPDPECQKMVEAELRNEEIKREMMRNDQEKRVLQRIAAKRVA